MCDLWFQIVVLVFLSIQTGLLIRLNCKKPEVAPTEVCTCNGNNNGGGTMTVSNCRLHSRAQIPIRKIEKNIHGF